MNSVKYGVISPSEIEISDSELSARLGRGVKSSDEDIKRVSAEILGAANMRFSSIRIRILDIDGDTVSFDGFSVTSSALAAYFSGSAEAYMFVTTLGAEVDRLIMKKKALSLSDGFIFDAVASAIIEAVCDAAEKKICGEERTRKRFSPGYADCPITVQKDLLSFVFADKYAGIKLLDSMLMTPMKSISAFAAILS